MREGKRNGGNIRRTTIVTVSVCLSIYVVSYKLSRTLQQVRGLAE